MSAFIAATPIRPCLVISSISFLTWASLAGRTRRDLARRQSRQKPLRQRPQWGDVIVVQQQSALIAEAYRNHRRLRSINEASAATSDPVELVFVVDEISLPTTARKMVCDVLALRRDEGRCTPVLLELKDSRMLKRLVEQVEDYAALIDAHAPAFAKLFEAVLGEPVKFDAPTEKWIVWPIAGEERDPREDELAERGVRVVGYKELDAGRYAFRVGRAP